MTRMPWVTLILFIAAVVTVLSEATTATISASAARQSSPNWKWQEMTPSGGAAPEARNNGVAIYDPVTRRIILFGGQSGSRHFNDLWAFDIDAHMWTPLMPSGAPPAPRRGHNAVYDPVGHQMVVWAGQEGGRFYDDTWTLDLTTLQWRNVSPSVRPRARYGSASVYDPVARALVQFAGFTSESRRFQDTQAFDLDTNLWQDLTPAGEKPQIRCLHTAAYDPAMRRMIMYGGQRSGPLDDLWAFDLTTRAWTPLTPAQRPAGRFFATSFVGRDGHFIVFGGSTSAGNVNDTWAFNFESGQWSRIEIDNPPLPRNGMMGAYIEEEERFIIFGGIGARLFNDVWELRNHQ